MGLKEELSMRTGFLSVEHEALLNIYLTGDILKKRARLFCRKHGITDVQFNVMMLLYWQTPEGQALTQAELSKMMLVNPSNVTSILDRMERDRLVTREVDPGDRRINEIVLTLEARRLVQEMDADYMREVEKIMGTITPGEIKDLIEILGKIRLGASNGGNGGNRAG